MFRVPGNRFYSHELHMTGVRAAYVTSSIAGDQLLLQLCSSHIQLHNSVECYREARAVMPRIHMFLHTDIDHLLTGG